MNKNIPTLKNKGASVTISQRNICDLEDTKKLVSEVNGCIGGVFHLAGILQDKPFESMRACDFKLSCDPKVKAALNLDLATRSCGMSLDYFVVSSSISANRRIAGQTNYGYANSAMERICEQRKREGLAGLAIQFGLVGEVGMASDTYELGDVIAGTTPQSIASLLASLDVLLSQPAPVVTSCVNAKRPTVSKVGESSFSETVFRIMGLGDAVFRDEVRLGDLGLDSLLALEVKQLVERKTGKFITTQVVKNMTTQQVKDLN